VSFLNELSFISENNLSVFFQADLPVPLGKNIMRITVFNAGAHCILLQFNGFIFVNKGRRSFCVIKNHIQFDPLIIRHTAFNDLIGRIFNQWIYLINTLFILLAGNQKKNANYCWYYNYVPHLLFFRDSWDNLIE
jgi:hypothetical protein